MSTLIDSYKNTLSEINGEWYFSKPIQLFNFRGRIKDVCSIITGKSIAVHFKIDTMKKKGK